MATTQTDISVNNGALSLFGGGAIESFDEDSDLAVTCSGLYSVTVNTLMSMYPWRFAVSKRQLVKDADITPLNEWNYAFALPSNMLAGPWAVFGDGRELASQLYEIYDAYLYCDYDTVIIDYTKRVDESYWPWWFIELACLVLASKYAIPVSDQVSKADLFHEKAYGPPQMMGRGGFYAECRRLNAQTQPMKSLFVTGDPLTSARFAGVSPSVEGETP